MTIFCSGSMVYNSLKAAEKLDEDNISCTVVNVHTIKPLDNNAIDEAAKNSKMLVSVEEHNIIGGLGSAISERLTDIKNSPKLLRIGIEDEYSKGGSYDFLKEKHGLSVDKIVNNISSNLRKEQ